MISPEVMKELLSVRQVLHYLSTSPSTDKGWTAEESQLFWMALVQFPQGPWTIIAEFIGTKSTRQAMTHGQKLRQKLKRWNKRLRRNPVVGSLLDEITVTSDGHISLGSSTLHHHTVLMRTGVHPVESPFVKVEQPSHVKQEELRMDSVSTNPVRACGTIAPPLHMLTPITEYSHGWTLAAKAIPIALGHEIGCNGDLTHEKLGPFCRSLGTDSSADGVLLTVGHLVIHPTKSAPTTQDLLAVRQVLHYLSESQSAEKGWISHEQQLFWVALTKSPQGPWTAIATYIGTKSPGHAARAIVAPKAQGLEYSSSQQPRSELTHGWGYRHCGRQHGSIS
ncbi:hypothetical protein PHYPSEUDO_004111 [Phytophthora pseudosyringae]|uniref:Myb-like domain-containing protein n=1 Tax=Phytophthora pseudosyringae TaxID=221518 RepID=A0A8T1WIT5_9STRA|nr:hypothetical protein PHYPSEUDO_004111 [Phytophthora pseudosyringae]